MRISVEDSRTGRLIKLDVKNHQRIERLIDVVVKNMRIISSEQRSYTLVLNNQELPNNITVKEATHKYGLKDENTLHIYHLDPKPITSAVQANKLKGTITRKGASEGEKNNAGSSVKSIGCVIITDSSANIVGFIEAKKAEELYSDVMKFERVK